VTAPSRADASPATPAGAPMLDVDIDHVFPGRSFRLQVKFQSTASCLALFGPSGSGKSTLLEAIAGLVHPNQGAIRLGGAALLDRGAGVDLPPRQRRVGLVLQSGLLFPLLSVRDNLLFGAPRERPRLTLAQVAELLEITHLLDRSPRNLSGGERQRVALGRAALSEPSLLLCDEPFAALDAPLRRRLVPTLGRIRELLEIPLVLVSHNASEVLALADDVVVLAGGRMRAHGPPASLLTELQEEDPGSLNYWEGVVDPDADHPSLCTVRVGEQVLHASYEGAPPGARIRLTVSANHVALAKPAPTETSQRNQLTGRVVSLAERDGLLLVSVDAGLRVLALVTQDAAHELGLSVGDEIVARIKATALRVLSVGSAGERVRS
jgi:molybdate transport system ATP-binding protein